MRDGQQNDPAKGWALFSSTAYHWISPPAQLDRPALFVWGTDDRLIPPGFGRHVRKWLPSAEQVTIERCGHVPQVERPDETNELLMSFFARADAGSLDVIKEGLDAEAA